MSAAKLLVYEFTIEREANSIVLKIMHRRKFWLSVLLVVASALWLIWPSYTELDNDVLRADHSMSGDVTDVVAKHLPTNFHEAEEVLERLGFTAGHRTVGAIYQRRVPPEPPLVDAVEKGIFVLFNQLLDEYDAVFVKKFYRSIPRLIFPNPGIHLYLFMKKDGSMAVRANIVYPILFP